jgi:hypothetical protein
MESSTWRLQSPNKKNSQRNAYINTKKIFALRKNT